jgi:uncharacterized protein YraI
LIRHVSTIRQQERTVFRYFMLALALTLAGATTASASWVTRDLNLRSGPGMGHHVRDVLRTCTWVDVHDQRGNWLRVSTHRGTGWVSARYVSAHRPGYCHGQRQGQRHGQRHVQHAPRAEIYIEVLPQRPRVIHRAPRSHEWLRRHRYGHDVFDDGHWFWPHW